jgi:hypothetical protein
LAHAAGVVALDHSDDGHATIFGKGHTPFQRKINRNLTECPVPAYKHMRRPLGEY